MNKSEKHFKQFYLNNTAITELEENTFFEITFDEIYIFNATKLKLINKSAFNGTNSVTKKFIVNYALDHKTALNDSPPTHDIFYMLSSLINLERICLYSTNISKIPSHAFRLVNGTQNKLSFIEFAFSPIVEIGDNSFSSLNNLSHLSFDYTNIQTIPKTAFSFDKDSNISMDLFFQETKLNSTSFAIGSLDNLKRPTNIYLGFNPNLTYLDQHVFQPFLESNAGNKVIFQTGEHFDCNDCRSYWLKKESKYNNRTDLKICSNKKNYTDVNNFAKCVELFI